jgi:hypothetical protein
MRKYCKSFSTAKLFKSSDILVTIVKHFYIELKLLQIITNLEKKAPIKIFYRKKKLKDK